MPEWNFIPLWHTFHKYLLVIVTLNIECHFGRVFLVISAGR